MKTSGVAGPMAMIACLSLANCGGAVKLVPPEAGPVAENTLSVEKSRDQVWERLIPALSKKFFVINTIDRSSGLINISYSGDPEKYVDCGRIISVVKNARGERTYDFPAARAQQSYEVMDHNGLFFLDRNMKLDGRVNLIVEAVGPRRTRVTASTRYVVTRTAAVRDASGRNINVPPVVLNFNTGGGESFPAIADGRAIKCVANGNLERELLSLVGE